MLRLEITGSFPIKLNCNTYMARVFFPIMFKTALSFGLNFVFLKKKKKTGIDNTPHNNLLKYLNASLEGEINRPTIHKNANRQKVYTETLSQISSLNFLYSDIKTPIKNGNI